MVTNEEVLQIISNETIDSLHNIGIVTPSIYKSIFSKHASVHNADIKDEDKVTDFLLDSKITMCQNFQEKNSENIIELSHTTSKAITAIKDKDESGLKKVLAETQALKKEIEKLKEAVYKDELTHAYNRKWMKDQYLDEDNNFTFAGTLVIIDLNFFKLINDNYGHVLGDKVLVFLTSQLKKTKEAVIRYGGDEFIVVFKNIHQGEAFEKINAVREIILAKKLKSAENSFRVSFSIGTYRFEKGHNISQTIEFADKNMYEDKIKIKKRIPGLD